MPRRKVAKPQAEQLSPPPVFDRRLMEKQMQAIGRLLAEQEFASLEEANAFLQQQLSAGQLPDLGPETPLEQAQELIYQAFEATGKRRLQLARQALEISPDCADAYVLLAEAASTPEEARPLYEQGIAAGERALGPEIFAEAAGEFWGILETRPYMRARQGLADVLWALDQRQEAISHLQGMLYLNPNDNQGVRYMLTNWLLTVGDDAAVEQLLAQYPDNGGAAWDYSRALIAFRRHGAGELADAALRQALMTNPFVPYYLLGVKEFPRDLPPYHGLGDENEAIHYLVDAVENWLETPQAIEWLATTVIGNAPKSPRQRQRVRKK